MTERTENVRAAQALLEAARALPPSPDPRSILKERWPLPPPSASLEDRYRMHLDRARVCCALAHDAATDHEPLRKLAAWSPLSASPFRAACGALELRVGDPYVYPFDLLAAITQDVVHADPVFSAATLLRGFSERSKTIEPLLARLQVPLELLRQERHMVLQLDLTRSRSGQALPNPADALARYAGGANAEFEKRAHARQPVGPMFRLPTYADSHREFAAVLTRSVGGREVHVLRPLSGDPTLVLAYATDCRDGASSGRTVRVRTSALVDRGQASRHPPRPGVER